MDDVSLFDLALAACYLGREDEAQSFFKRAREAGSREPSKYITARGET